MAQGSRDRKILRIGIIQNGRIVEERLLRKRESVSIGQASRNTFVLPSAGVPKSYTLFELKGGVYSLNFKPNMTGKVSVDDSVLDLKAIRDQKLASKRGDRYALTLSEKSRGKVVIDDVTLLFQFVTPPPPPSKLQLPASVRGGWIKSIDWPFANILLGSFIFQVFTVAFIVTRDYPEPPRGINTLPDRFVEMIVKETPPPPELEKQPEKKDEEGDQPAEKKPEKKVVKKKKPEPAPVKKAEPSDTPKKKKTAAEMRAIQEKVNNRTILKHIGAVGEGGSLVDSLRDGASEVTMAAAFDGTSGVIVADADTKRDRRGGAIGNSTGKVVGLEAGDLKAKGSGESVTSGKKGKEVKVRGKVSVKKPSEVFGMGKLDAAAIAKAVGRRKGAIKSCYEKELKRDPKLKGKVKIQFTILQSGRVGSTKVLTNTTNNQSVATCIRNSMKRWRFPKPDGGDVTVAFPFVFTPSS